MDRVTRLLPLIAFAIVLPLVSGNVSAQTLAAGSSHTVVRTPDGSVWGWGLNNAGQLGDGTVTSRAVPTQVPSLSDVVAIAAGSAHTLVLKSDGTVWAFGSNFYGQLGDGSTTNRNSPVLALGLTNVVAIAAGANHSVALTSSGAVWTWGSNGNGQLGDGTTTRATQPLVVTSLTASAIGAGWNHTLAVKADGSVAVWGANGNGQLGDGSTTQRTTPVAMSSITTAVAVTGGSAHSLVMLADWTVKSSGLNSSGALGDGTTTQRTSPVSVSSLSGVAAIAAGQHSSYAVKSDGSASAWGGNASAQLGDGTWTQRTSPVAISGLTGLAALAAGDVHAIAVTTAGVVSTWGSNASSKLGDGTTSPRETPGAISEAAYLWKVGTPLFSATGSQYTERAVTITTATPGATIHYTTNGDVPTELDAAVSGPIDVTQSQTIKARAFKTGHAPSEVTATTYTLIVAPPMFSPGSGTYTSARTVTITTTSPGVTIHYTLDGSTPTEVSPAYMSALTVGTTTTVKAVGFRAGWTQSSMNFATYAMNFGTLSAPDLSPATGTFASDPLVTMSAMSGATIRYTTNGTSPNGSSTAYTAPFAVTSTTTIKARAFHPDYTTSPESMATYTLEVATPTFTPTSGTYAAGQMVSISTSTPGATLRYTLNGLDPTTADPVVPAGGLTVGKFTIKVKGWRAGANASAVAIASYDVTGTLSAGRLSGAANHSLAVRPDGALFGWGANSSYQLGDGTTTARPLPVLISGVTGAVAVAAGDSHQLAATAAGAVFAWGANTNGQLGDGSTTQRTLPVQITLTSVSAVAAGLQHSLALKTDGTVWAWGWNNNGQLGIGSTATQVTPVQISTLAGVSAVVARSYFSLAQKTDGTLWSWGQNGNGQLGLGDLTGRTSPVQLALTGVTAIAAGTSHALAVLSDGTVRAWGHNGSGQLGDGTATQRTSPVSVSGLTNVIAVAAGASHSLALHADGSVSAWGSNANGQLGDDTTTTRQTPVSVIGLPAVVSIAAGTNQSLAIADDGSVWTWGRNADAQLGDGTSVQRNSPVQIAGPGMSWKITAPVLSVASGTYAVAQTVTITSADPAATLHYTTDGSEPTQAAPTIASGGTVAVNQSLTLKARAWKPGAVSSETATGAYVLKAVSPAFSLAGGRYGSAQTVALSTTTSGASITYTLDGTEPLSTSSAYTGSLSVSSSQTIKARAFKTGWTASDSSASSYWISAGTVATPVITPAGGSSFEHPPLVTITSATTGATIRYTLDGSVPTERSASYLHAILVTDSATVKARAFRDDYAPSATASAVFSLDAAGQTAMPGVLPAGGRFATGQTVAVGGPSGATLRYTTDGSDPTAGSTEVPTSGEITIAASTILKVRAFASGSEPSRVRRADFVITGAIAAGDQHTVALKNDGSVVAWGMNNAGQLGDGTTVSSTTPVQSLTGVRTIAAGGYRTGAVKYDGTAWMWGLGPLGNGITNTSYTPVQITGLTDVVALAIGSDHALALKADGSVWAWGNNQSGQLGVGTTAQALTPVQVPGLAGVTALAAGDGFSVVVQSDGASGGLVWAWGKNDVGQLGDGSTLTRLSPVLVPDVDGARTVVAGPQYAFAVHADGTVRAWGSNAHKQTGVAAPAQLLTPRAVAPLAGTIGVAAGLKHALSVDLDGLAWGWGTDGGVDLLAAGTWTAPALVQGLSGVLAAVAGIQQSVWLKADGTVWAAGSGPATGLTGSPVYGVTQIPNLSLADNASLLLDPDGDGLPTWREYAAGTDPLARDSNGNGLSDLVEVRRRSLAANPDDDGDGLSNALEALLGTDPFNPDSDGDSVTDGADHFPLDATRTQMPAADPNDTTPPTIILIRPANAKPIGGGGG